MLDWLEDGLARQYPLLAQRYGWRTFEQQRARPKPIVNDRGEEIDVTTFGEAHVMRGDSPIPVRRRYVTKRQAARS